MHIRPKKLLVIKKIEKSQKLRLNTDFKPINSCPKICYIFPKRQLCFMFPIYLYSSFFCKKMAMYTKKKQRFVKYNFQ